MRHHKKIDINIRGTDTIYAVILNKCQKYPSKLIRKHANILVEVIKLHGVNLFNMTQYNKCTVIKSTYAQ